MQDLIKRYFWVLGALVVCICAVFAAQATSHIVEAKFLGEAEHAPKIAAMVPSPMQPAKQVRSKDGSPFTARNMFCSDCTPAVAAVNTDPSSIQTTTLPLMLLATNVGLTDEQSYATIVNTENQKQGAYSIGDPIPGASGKLKEIHFKYVDFENGGHTERLVLMGANVPPPTPVAQTETKPAGEGDEMSQLVDKGVKKTGEDSYEIDKALIAKVLENPMAIAKGARVVPAVKDGKPDGFKLYAIRPDSVFAKIGLTNGDTLQAINGMELTTADKALEVYTKLREATSLEVEVTRRGKPMTLKYSIR